MHHFDRWRDALNHARNETELIDVVRNYISALNASVVETLPPDCQAALRDPSDIQAAAVTILQGELAFRGDGEMGALLHEIAHTFAAASVRLTRLRRESISPGD